MMGHHALYKQFVLSVLPLLAESAIRSKKRYCQQCFESMQKKDEERRESYRDELDHYGRYFDRLHKREMKRMSKPIESCITDLERYMILLPDLSEVLKKQGFDPLNEDQREELFENEYYMTLDIEHMFKDKVPSEQELTK
jgi:hypothetical protein